jgi:signal transduction histidine kinase
VLLDEDRCSLQHRGSQEKVMPQPRGSSGNGSGHPARAAIEDLAAAAAEMARTAEAVPRIAVRTAVDLGFDGAAFRVLETDPPNHRLLESEGLGADASDPGSVSAAIADAVLETGLTVVAGEVDVEKRVDLPTESDRVAAAVGCPVWVLGWISAVLIGTASGRVSGAQVRALELLASHAGLSLASGQRAELERGVTASIQEGDRLKNDFLTTISHEMRTPLTVLMGSGRTLEASWDTLDDPGRRELLAAMNANVAVLDRLVSDLLDHSRLEAGELWVSFEPFDVSGVLERLADDAERSRWRIRRDVEPDVLASGDVILIRRTLSILIDNALAHTPQGTTVTVSCKRVGAEVEIAVADDGPGIPERDLPYLGERFFRGGSLTERPKGLGLGLALARGILDLHDSALMVTSEAGTGSRFSFSLPWVSDPSRSSGREAPTGRDVRSVAQRDDRS